MPSPTAVTSRHVRRCAIWPSFRVDRIATVCGRYYAMDRDNRLDGRSRVRADPRRRGNLRAIRRGGRESYERGITDEFVEPVVLSGRPRLDRARRRDLLQLPARPRAPALRAPARGRGRPDDDDALPRRLPVPGRVRGAGGRDTLAEVLAATGSPAPRRRDREVRARDLLLQRRRGAGVGGRDPVLCPRRATSRATT